MEVVKIRLQAQHHSMADPLDVPKYRNAAHAMYTVIKEEGFGALYRGVSLTALRQGSNQAGKISSTTHWLSMSGYSSVVDMLYVFADSWSHLISKFHRIHQATHLSSRLPIVSLHK